MKKYYIHDMKGYFWSNKGYWTNLKYTYTLPTKYNYFTAQIIRTFMLLSNIHTELICSSSYLNEQKEFGR